MVSQKIFTKKLATTIIEFKILHNKPKSGKAKRAMTCSGKLERRSTVQALRTYAKANREHKISARSTLISNVCILSEDEVAKWFLKKSLKPKKFLPGK